MSYQTNPSVAITQSEKGRLIKIGPLKLYVLEDGRLTSERLSVVEIVIPPHQNGPPEHYHNMHDETFLVTKGNPRFLTETGSHDVSVGDFVSVPVKAQHTFLNPSDSEARMVCTMTRAFYIHYFELLEEASKSGTELTKEQHFEAMAKYATFAASKEKKA